MAIAPIKIIITAVDDFSKTLGKNQRALQKFGGGMKSAGRAMSLGLTLPLVALGASAIKTSTEFERAMNKVEALTQAGAQGMKDMRDSAKKLGIETQFSASEAADAMGFLGMAGWKTNEILEGTPHLLNLAASSQMDLARTADIASNIMGAFRIEARDTGKVADILAATTASSNVNLEMLAETFKNAGPIAKTAGASIKDLAVAAGFLGNIGIQGAQAGTALKNMFIKLATPGGRAAQILDHFGIKVADAAGNMRPYADVLTDLSGKMADLGSQKKLMILNELFGKRVIAGAAALTDDLKGVNSGFRELSASLSNVDGRAKSMADTMLKGAPGAFKMLASAWEGFQIAIGESGLLEWVTELLTKLTMFIRKIANLNPNILKMAVIIGAVVAALGPMLVIIGSVISAIGSIGGAIAGAGGAIAILSNPIGWFVGAILGLIALAVAMKTQFGFSLKKVAMGFLVLSGPIGWITAFFIKNFSRFLPFLKLLGLGFMLLGKLILFIFWPVFKLFEMIGGVIGPLFDMIMSLIEAITRLVLPKWLEKKIGLTANGDETTTPAAGDLVAETGGVIKSKNENTTNIKIENRTGAEITTDTEQGEVNLDVDRGLAFGF